MAAVLLLVGQGLEHPSIVQQLLDIDAVNLKPQYNMASEVTNLVLFTATCPCGFSLA